MDSTICGLNKVICYAISEEQTGTVTITNGINTWTATIADGKATFLIPSIPVPARKTYTVSQGEWSHTFQIGYGDIIEIYLGTGYDAVLEKDFEEYKDEVDDDLEDIKDMLTDETTEKTFQFGIDADGRYGYIKDGADTVTPFKDGSETLCYRLGTGRKFDVKMACTAIKNSSHKIDIDYTKLTKDNFIAQLKSSSVSGSMIYCTNNDDIKDFSCGASAVFEEVVFSYNNETGVLELSKGDYYGVAYGWYASSANQPVVGSRGTSYTGLPDATVYLIISIN